MVFLRNLLGVLADKESHTNMRAIDMSDISNLSARPAFTGELFFCLPDIDEFSSPCSTLDTFTSTTTTPDVEADFSAYDALPGHEGYALLRQEMRVRECQAIQCINRMERRGYDVSCVRQMWEESHWLAESTSYFARTRSVLDAIETSLQMALVMGEELPAPANDQWEGDGSWARCTQEPFLKFEFSIDHMIRFSDGKTRGKEPDYPLVFLDQIRDPASPASSETKKPRVLEYLEGLVISNILKDGVDRRKELNYSASNVIRLFKNFKFDSEEAYWHMAREFAPYYGALIAFLDGWQNPKTGFWGPWYERGGKIEKANDLSITYHILAYRKGKVNNWPAIVGTLLAMKDEEYPRGWKENGEQMNHHNMDVLIMLNYARKAGAIGDEQKLEIDGLVLDMVDHCLAVLGPEMKITPDDDDGIAAGYSQAVAVLKDADFFRASNAYDLPESYRGKATEVYAKLKTVILERMKEKKDDSVALEDALDSLERARMEE